MVESSKDDLLDKAAQAYLKALAQIQSVLLVAPTWVEIEAVTEKVRSALKSSGRLALDEKEFSVFDSLSWTEAQKRDTRQYRPGMAIHFHRRTAGFTKDETVAVIAIENDALKVQHADGSENLFLLGAGCACFDVGEKRKLKIAAGDKLLLQANASRKRFINGELVEVLAIQGDSVLLADGRVIPQNYRTFTHGYAVTSHAAQGKTVDEVLVIASSRSLPAINQQQFYVSISRGRDTCRVFTDDAEMLRSHVTRSSARLAAVEVVPRVSSRKFIQTILQRGHRFLKQFRLRRAPRQTILPDKAVQQIEPPRYEHKRTSTHRISIIGRVIILGVKILVLAVTPRSPPSMFLPTMDTVTCCPTRNSCLPRDFRIRRWNRIRTPRQEKTVDPALPPPMWFVLGSGLKRLEGEIQKYELKFVKSAGRRLAALLNTPIAAVTIAFTKGDTMNPESSLKIQPLEKYHATMTKEEKVAEAAWAWPHIPFHATGRRRACSSHSRASTAVLRETLFA